MLAVPVSCKKKSEDPQQQVCTYVPTYVDTVINLKDYRFWDLQNKGYTYIKGGYRGIVIRKESDAEYKAFERASTYKMAEIGCPVVVDKSLFFLKDTCNGSKFDFAGNILEGPAICPLLPYHVALLDQDKLRIYHSQ